MFAAGATEMNKHLVCLQRAPGARVESHGTYRVWSGDVNEGRGPGVNKEPG